MADGEGAEMKIEFLTQDDPLYILPFFEEFLRHYRSEFDIVRISCCRTMGKRPRVQLLHELLWLYGASGLAKLLWLVAKAKALARVPATESANQFYSIAQVARAHGVPWRQVKNPNHEAFVSDLKVRRPDLLVSVACPYVLKETVLGIPARGCINIHHAPLPRYKGMMPTFWQLYHGERELGLTIHTMSAKIDEGEALLQESVPLDRSESLHELVRRSKRFGAHCMARVLRALEANTVARIPMDQVQGSYFTFPRREEALEFRRRGLRAI